MKNNIEYLQSKIVENLPSLMDKVKQVEDGKFLFFHESFPELRVEGITLTYVEDQLERVIRKNFKYQSSRHVDYLFNLLNK